MIPEFLQQRIESGDFPSAVYLVAEKGQVVKHGALGQAVVEPELFDAGTDSVYDLASLTKVLATGLLTAVCLDQGELALDQPVRGLVPEFDREGFREITVRHLLAHNSGLPGWLPLYLLTDDPQQVVKAIIDKGLAYQTGSKVVYSDPNFIVLGRIIETLLGSSIDAAFENYVTSKLGISTSEMAFNPLRDTLLTLVAASELGNAFERNTCIELGFLEPNDPRGVTHFRSEQIWGEVHDLNAYFLGGAAGHAGLFGTAEQVFTVSKQFLPGSTTLLAPETCRLFSTNLTPGMDEHRSLAFQLASSEGSTAGRHMSPESFGHLGFTGTSLWIDPVRERIFVLLTNRTHAHTLPFVNINGVRRRFHDLGIDSLDKI